jgi:hypothetical protein
MHAPVNGTTSAALQEPSASTAEKNSPAKTRRKTKATVKAAHGPKNPPSSEAS